MRQFDEACLTPIHAFSATEIKALREHEEVSQTVFALYMKLLSLIKQKGLATIL